MQVIAYYCWLFFARHLFFWYSHCKLPWSNLLICLFESLDLPSSKLSPTRWRRKMNLSKGAPALSGLIMWWRHLRKFLNQFPGSLPYSQWNSVCVLHISLSGFATVLKKPSNICCAICAKVTRPGIKADSRIRVCLEIPIAGSTHSSRSFTLSHNETSDHYTCSDV